MSENHAPLFRLTTLKDVQAGLIGMGRVQCEMNGLSELDHGLQCADVLKAMAPEDLELQIAGLLHDIGVMHGEDRDHGRVGGLAVRALIGERVAELIRLHVDAKRYLVTTHPDYRGSLSPVSRLTLEQQGGDMSDAETAAFENSPFHHDAIRLRKADDLAKTPGKSVPQLDAWLPVLEQMIRPIR